MEKPASLVLFAALALLALAYRLAFPLAARLALAQWDTGPVRRAELFAEPTAEPSALADWQLHPD